MSTRNVKKIEQCIECGDTNKVVDKPKANRDETLVHLPDRGDTNDKKDKPSQQRILNLAERKRIRDKYTIKLKPLEQNVNVLDKPSLRTKTISTTEDSKIKNQTVSIDTSVLENTCRKIDESKKEKAIKKPIIKTLISNSDRMRIYKAITFIDQRRQKANLQINLPMPAKKLSKSTETYRLQKPESKTSVQKSDIKKTGNRKRFRRKLVTSPASTRKGNFSPPTEVAKWAPTSVNKHTKPYYEAWVNTKLTAVSRENDFSESERIKFLKTFKNALKERIHSPELVYKDLADERFTGRIKIRHR